MRNFQGGAGFGAILAGILSRATPGLPGFFERMLFSLSANPRIQPRRAMRAYGRLYAVAGPDSREAARRRRQGAHYRQRCSHLPGTVKPAHIFGEVRS